MSSWKQFWSCQDVGSERRFLDAICGRSCHAVGCERQLFVEIEAGVVMQCSMNDSFHGICGRSCHAVSCESPDAWTGFATQCS